MRKRVISAVLDREDVLFGEFKGPGGKSGVAKRRQGWEEVADAINAQFTSSKRSPEECRKKYNNAKQRTRAPSSVSQRTVNSKEKESRGKVSEKRKIDERKENITEDTKRIRLEQRKLELEITKLEKEIKLIDTKQKFCEMKMSQRRNHERGTDKSDNFPYGGNNGNKELPYNPPYHQFNNEADGGYSTMEDVNRSPCDELQDNPLDHPHQENIKASGAAGIVEEKTGQQEDISMLETSSIVEDKTEKEDNPMKETGSDAIYAKPNKVPKRPTTEVEDINPTENLRRNHERGTDKSDNFPYGGQRNVANGNKELPYNPPYHQFNNEADGGYSTMEDVNRSPCDELQDNPLDHPHQENIKARVISIMLYLEVGYFDIDKRS
uniref:Myb/SANT-like DNA-binding domain-containing protein n=1 Tax=Magallana gigas TaxID=29159 RepID=K1R3B2_MAGGI